MVNFTVVLLLWKHRRQLDQGPHMCQICATPNDCGGGRGGGEVFEPNSNLSVGGVATWSRESLGHWRSEPDLVHKRRCNFEKEDGIERWFPNGLIL